MQNQLSSLSQRWLRLSLIKKRSPAFWLALLDHFKLTIEQLFSLPVGELSQCGLRPDEIAVIISPGNEVEPIEQWLCQHPLNQIITISDAAYPERLKQLDSPPLILYCHGNAQLLKAPQLAIVGSRKATINGLNTARRLAQELGEAGITVTSGLALGIDGAAHQGAYPTSGRTVAILGGGLGCIYPRSHQTLASNMVEHGGCLVSEFPPWETVKPYHFPRRNRLIAALSSGVLLIEARIKSGSMITANLAADMGIDVFATPGNINNPLSEGPHYLIQQGARLVTCSGDICEELGWVVKDSEDAGDNHQQDEVDESLLKEFAGEPINIDYLVEKTGLSVNRLMPRLVELELQGRIVAVPGGYTRAMGPVES
ncbi:DNA-protecting protein DprA [Alteromonas sp. ZYF713]|nr:DNA-protecting protein DprA [Alteromonas sp. ZYF713]